MTVIESRSTCRSYVLTIASTSTHLISLWRQALNLSDQSHIETASLWACASMPTTNLGSSTTLRERICILARIVLSFHVLPRIGAGGAARLQTSIRGLSPQAGGFRRRPNRPSSVGCGSRCSLTHCPQGRLPCVTASVYQTPAVPYHTPIRGSLSTPNIAALSSGEQYNTKQTPR